MTGARVRIPPSPPSKTGSYRACFALQKRRRDSKGAAGRRPAKNHPVNGFLAPRAGGGTGPVDKVGDKVE